MKRTICIALLLVTTLLQAESLGLGLNTVVIDPGHGGRDPGSVSRDKKTYEKTFTLDISRKLAAMIREAYPGVEVIMTRDEDVFVSVDERAEKANRAGADLFISIHVNSSPSETPSGCTIHVLGQSSNKNRDLFSYNMDVCKRENSVVHLESDYSTKYQGFDPQDPESYIFMQLMQNSHLQQSLDFAQICSRKLASSPLKSSKGVWQDPFLVLWKTSMPAVLVESGFLSNSSDLKILRQEENRTGIAVKLFEAFKEFKALYDASLSLNDGQAKGSTQISGTPKKEEKADTKTKPAASPETAVNSVRYGVQVFSLKTRLPEGDSRLLGFEPVIIKSGQLNKYVIGVSSSRKETEKNLETIRKKYPDSFIVTLH